MMSANLFTVDGIRAFLTSDSPKSMEEKWKELLILHPHCTITSYEEFQRTDSSFDMACAGEEFKTDFMRHLFNIQTSSRLLKLLRANDQAAIAQEFQLEDVYLCRITGAGIEDRDLMEYALRTMEDRDLMKYTIRTRDELIEIIRLFDAAKKLHIVFCEPANMDVILEPVLQAIAKTQPAGRFGISFETSSVNGNLDFGPSPTQYQTILTLIESGQLYEFNDNIYNSRKTFSNHTIPTKPFRDFVRLMTAISSPGATKGFRLGLRVWDDHSGKALPDQPSETILIILTTLLTLGRCPSNLHLMLDEETWRISDRTCNGFIEALSLDQSKPRLNLTIINSDFSDRVFSAVFNPRLKTKLDSSQLASLSINHTPLTSLCVDDANTTFIPVCPDRFDLDLSRNKIDFTHLKKLLNDLKRPDAPKHLTLDLDKNPGLLDPNFPRELASLLASPDLPPGLRLHLFDEGHTEMHQQQYNALVQAADLENTPPGFQLRLTTPKGNEGGRLGDALQRNTNAHATAALTAFTLLCCQARLKREGQTHFPRDIQYLIIFLLLPNWWHRSNKAPRRYPEVIKTLSFFTPKKEVAQVSGSESEQGREKRLKPAEDLSFPG